jgi:AcrR family transcriptional regulator
MDRGAPMGAKHKAPDAAARSVGPSLAPTGKLKPGPGLPATQVAEHQRARIHSAMIEIVAAHGYSAVKVREVVLLAGVSTRAFYEHFNSKEDCFLRTYEMVVRRASQRIIASQAGEPDWRARPLMVFEGFIRGLESEPDEARFALIEAYAAGPAALELARRAERTFELMLGESFARAPDGVTVPRLVLEGMVGGIAGVVRGRLRADRDSEIAGLGAELTTWALSYPGESAGALAGLDGQAVWRNTMLEPLTLSSGEGETWPPTGDRALLLAAVSTLFATSGYGRLTITRIRSEAKVSRKIFDANFNDVEGCFLAALEHKAGEAAMQAARAQAAGSSWPGGIYRGIAALCEQVANEPLLARVCLADDFVEGSLGAQARLRLLTAMADQLGDRVPIDLRRSPLITEASGGAIWSLFHHHIVRDWAQRQQLAASLAFMALAPVIGDVAAVSSIQSEQRP